MIKKTKIVATMGPASEDPKILDELIRGGFSVARMNLAHGSYEDHIRRINLVRESSKRLGIPVSILLDVKGPEIRTHNFLNGSATMVRDTIVRIAMKEVVGTAEKFSVNYPNLFDDVDVGQKIRVEDGKLTLTIIEKDSANRELVTKVYNTHTIKDRRNVNAPLARLAMPFISKKDRDDIKFGCEMDVDFIATSFTRRPQDVVDVKKVLAEFGKPNTKIVAKIENQEGVDNFEAIMEVADGAMVARGDLGVEVEPEEVPIIQKRMVKHCKNLGKPCIVATQMLDSMTTNPNPTRAEVSDVANAVLEGTDSVMLSVETAAGQYPVESVRMQAKIATRIEQLLEYHRIAEDSYFSSKKNNSDAIAYSVANTAILVDAAAIIAITQTGSTPIRISRFRPVCPILALVTDHKVENELTLHWGVFPMVINSVPRSFADGEAFAREAAEKFGIAKGRPIIITGGNGSGNTNYMRIVIV